MGAAVSILGFCQGLSWLPVRLCIAACCIRDFGTRVAERCLYVSFPKLFVTLRIWDSGVPGLPRPAKQERGSLKLHRTPLLCNVQAFSSGLSCFLSPCCCQRAAFVVFLQLPDDLVVVSEEVLRGLLSEQFCGFVSDG